MKSIFLLFFLCFSINAHSQTDPDFFKQVKSLATKATWTLDSLDYAIKNKKSSSLCYSLGSLSFIIKDLSDRTLKNNLLTGDLVTDKTLINLIRTLPLVPTFCASSNFLDSEDFEMVSGFKVEMYKKLKQIINLKQ